MMNKYAILLVSEVGLKIAKTIMEELPGTQLYAKFEVSSGTQINSIDGCLKEIFNQYQGVFFVGAMGICVRSIAPYINNKHNDPAVVCIDSTGKYVISVLSGHIGGANDLTKRIARILGAEPVVSTQSDNNNLWALDTLGEMFNWKTETNAENLNIPLAHYVNRKPTALLLDIKDEGTKYLEQTKATHVDLFYNYSEIDFSSYDLLITVTPYLYPDTGIDVIYFHPKVLHLGVGCRKNCNPEGISEYIARFLSQQKITPVSVKDISTIDIKKDEVLLEKLHSFFNDAIIRVYSADELKEIEVPNPSDKVKEVTSVYGVAESVAIKSADNGLLILEKQKGSLSKDNDFTFAVALDKNAIRQGHIEIVGAGPGDPDLISIKGRQFLEAADLILYAGSLVPIELTFCAKLGAVVRSSASMDLEEQFAIMKAFYDKGELVVRLHTGDPCIYGAIQEQMAFFDKYNMSYHITPGISSFQAAAAALRSQFTIPEKVQTIILTRGEGRTSMPEKEKLHLLARSQSTMCIFLSVSIAEDVQKELLVHYPPETPIAVCYKLTWRDEQIYRGYLQNLATIIQENKLTLTTLIVVGESIDNRHGLSRLYANDFKHLFRK